MKKSLAWPPRREAFRLCDLKRGPLLLLLRVHAHTGIPSTNQSCASIAVVMSESRRVMCGCKTERPRLQEAASTWHACAARCGPALHHRGRGRGPSLSVRSGQAPPLALLVTRARAARRQWPPRLAPNRRTSGPRPRVSSWAARAWAHGPRQGRRSLRRPLCRCPGPSRRTSRRSSHRTLWPQALWSWSGRTSASAAERRKRS